MTKRLLIVDDDPDLQAVIQIALEKFAGWQVTIAASGPEALSKAEQEPLDAILLDISMPGMDGFTVFEQLQANPITQGIPVILLTAKVTTSDRRRFEEMQIAGVITKPFNPVMLQSQVANFLGW